MKTRRRKWAYKGFTIHRDRRGTGHVFGIYEQGTLRGHANTLNEARLSINLFMLCERSIAS